MNQVRVKIQRKRIRVSDAPPVGDGIQTHVSPIRASYPLPLRDQPITPVQLKCVNTNPFGIPRHHRSRSTKEMPALSGHGSSLTELKEQNQRLLDELEHLSRQPSSSEVTLKLLYFQ